LSLKLQLASPSVWYKIKRMPPKVLSVSFDIKQTFQKELSTPIHYDESKVPDVFTIRRPLLEVMCMTVLPNGWLASGFGKGVITFWDIEKGEPVQTFNAYVKEVKSLTVLPNGCLVSGSSDGHITIWNLQSGESVNGWGAHASIVNALAVLPNGLLASGSGDKTIKLWNVNTGELVKSLRGHEGYVCALTALPNGLLASGSEDNKIKIWNVENGKCVHTLSGRKDCSLVALPNGCLASISEDGKSINIWKVETGELVKSLPLPGCGSSLALLPNGWLASSSNNDEILLWNVESGKVVKTLSVRIGVIRLMTVLSNGHLAIYGGLNDNAIKSWPLCEYIQYAGFSKRGLFECLLSHPIMLLARNQLRVEQVPALFSESLERIDVSNTFITDELIKAILDQCPRLSEIKYDGCGWLTKAGIALIVERNKQGNATTTTSTSRTTSSPAGSSGSHVHKSIDVQLKQHEEPSSSSSVAVIESKQIIPPPPGSTFATVLYDHTTCYEYDLTIKVGDLVQILDEDPHGWKDTGWTYCQKGNIKGYITTTYLELSSPVTSSITAKASTVLAAKPSAVTSLAAVAAQAQQTSVADEELAKKLRQHVEVVASSLSSQTTADYQSLLSDVQREMQKQMQENEQLREQQQIEMVRLKNQLETATGNVRSELDARIKGLEKNQNLLMQDYNTQQAILAQREYILKQPELARFYNTAQNKLQQMFLAYKVIDSGLVVNKALSTTDKVIQAISLAGESIPLPGSHAVATWLGFAIQAGVGLANKKSGINDISKVNNVTELVVSFKELDDLTEATSRALTLMYEEQLKHVTPNSAGILAEAAVKLMVAYLWSGEYQKQALSDQLVASVARVFSQSKAQGFWQQLSQKFSDLKGKFKDSNVATKQEGENWTAYGVFWRPGLKTSANSIEHYFSGGGTQPELYGYRLGTKEEAQGAGLSQTTERVPSHVLAAKRLTQSDKAELSNVSKDTKAVKDQAELNAVQLRIERAKNEALAKEHAKLAEDMALVKQHLAQLGSPVSTAPASENIAKTIFMTGYTLSVDRSKIPDNKLAQLNSIMEASADNCSAEHIKYNRHAQITELTLPNAQFVQNLKIALIELLGISD